MSPRRLGVRGLRLALLVLAALAIRSAGEGVLELSSAEGLSLEQARGLFPGARAFGDVDRRLDAREVLDGEGRVLGKLLSTAPHTDDLIGYSGPSDVLVALSPAGRLLGARLVASGDTTAHVDDVRGAEDFWAALADLEEEPWSEVSAVSGSTLTSGAIVEGVERRLFGRTRSQRFPEPVSVEEARVLFPGAVGVEEQERGWLRVDGEHSRPLGWLRRTSPQADNVRGYRGPTESLVAFERLDGEVRGVHPRASYDTPDYVRRVREDPRFLAELAAIPRADWSDLDFGERGIEGVSGATQTSYAVAEGVRQSLAALEREADGAGATARTRGRELGLAALVLGGLVMAFGPWRARRGLRRAWQVVLVLGLGLLLGDLLSLALLVGAARHGLAGPLLGALGLWVAVALLVPWGTRRQLYCHHLCPHGALQEWVGVVKRFRVTLPAGVYRWLRRLPLLLLGAALSVAVLRPEVDLGAWEAFDAWVLGVGAALSLGLAVAGVVACLFVPLAYCRFACPTGALLELLRGHPDRLGVREAGAGALLAVLWAALAWSGGAPAAESEPRALGGRAFGTTWSLELREGARGPEVQEWSRRVDAELERIESRLSSWRAGSEVAQFNASATTLPLEVSDELLGLVALGLELSERTAGAFDLTVGPLVSAWGSGPAGEVEAQPGAEELRALLESVGWRKLEVDRVGGTLRKTHPDLELDLGALLQGYALDRAAAVLDGSGAGEYLLEIGGELLARGPWSVGVEDPRRPGQLLRTLELEDEALATSGDYRRRHLISPSSGRPLEGTWLSLSVRHRSGLAADAWGTALFNLDRARASEVLGEGVRALGLARSGEVLSFGEF